jgi:hypothetical protein
MHSYCRTLVAIKKREGVETQRKEQRLICMSDFDEPSRAPIHLEPAQQARRRHDGPGYTAVECTAAGCGSVMRLSLFVFGMTSYLRMRRKSTEKREEVTA